MREEFELYVDDILKDLEDQLCKRYDIDEYEIIMKFMAEKINERYGKDK